MKTVNRLILALLLLPGAATSQELLLEERGGVQLWSMPQDSPADGLLATVLELRAVNPEASLVTFGHFQLLGRVHHAWLDEPFGLPTPRAELTQPGMFFHEDWRKFDSHLLIDSDMLGGQAGRGLWTVNETNDGSTTNRIGSSLEKLPTGWGAKTGFGDVTADVCDEPRTGSRIRWCDSEGVFSYLIPELQSNVRPIAYVVGEPDAVFLTLGVLGPGIVDAGVADGAAFGYFGSDPVSVFPLPEPAGWFWILALLVAMRKWRSAPSIVFSRRRCKK